MKSKQPYPFLVRAYVEHVKPYTRGKRSTWTEAWVEGTHVFARKLIWAGVAVVVASWVHPELGWRLTLGPMGLITAAVGGWHRVYAQTIFELAVQRSQGQAEY